MQQQAGGRVPRNCKAEDAHLAQHGAGLYACRAHGTGEEEASVQSTRERRRRHVCSAHRTGEEEACLRGVWLGYQSLPPSAPSPKQLQGLRAQTWRSMEQARMCARAWEDACSMCRQALYHLQHVV